MQLRLAKAEIEASPDLPKLIAEEKALIARRRQLLKDMGLTEAHLIPQYTCKKCSDTGFLPDGKACDCYHP